MSTPKWHPLSITSAEFDARRRSEGRSKDARGDETHGNASRWTADVESEGKRQTDAHTDGMIRAYKSTLFALHGYRNYLSKEDATKEDAGPETSGRRRRSLRGEHYVVTGANQGIGYAVAKGLYEAGASVHAVVRDSARGHEAAERLKAEGKGDGGTIEVHECDLSSLAQTRAFVQRWIEGGKPLHGLVCNAGVMERKKRMTPEGFEYNFAVNTLCTYVLVNGLRPVLGRTAAASTAPSPGGSQSSLTSTPAVTPRVVLVSSGGMLTESLVTTDMEMRKMRQFDPVRQYARGKRHQVALVERWARLEEDTRARGHAYVGYYSMHPGWVETNGVKNALPKFYDSLKGKLRTPDEGADTILYLLSADVKELTPGAFYFDRKPVAKHITGGFTKYKAEAVNELANKLDSLATESSVRSEKNLLRSLSASALSAEKRKD